MFLEVRRDLCIGVLFLVETWHDPDDVCIRCLRADGFHVVDAPRSRAASDTAATNRGGIATVAFTGARLQQRHRSNRLCTSDVWAVWRRVARRVRPQPAVICDRVNLIRRPIRRL